MRRGQLEPRISRKDSRKVKLVRICYRILIVPDDLIIDLVRQRLQQTDCKINGWIMDGCPTTPKQIE